MTSNISLTVARLKQQNKMLRRKENTHQILLMVLSVLLAITLTGLFYFASTNYYHEKVLLKYYQKYGDIESLELKNPPAIKPA